MSDRQKQLAAYLYGSIDDIPVIERRPKDILRILQDFEDIPENEMLVILEAWWGSEWGTIFDDSMVGQPVKQT